MRIVLNFLAVVGGMCGAVLVASNIGVGVIGFSFFLLSSIASVFLLWSDKAQRGLLALNVFYVGVNVFGLVQFSGVTQ